MALLGCRSLLLEIILIQKGNKDRSLLQKVRKQTVDHSLASRLLCVVIVNTGIKLMKRMLSTMKWENENHNQWFYV